MLLIPIAYKVDLIQYTILKHYPPLSQQDVVKADAGHVGVEKYIAEIFSSWAVFRPQYMIGSGNNKDCEEWFFDRKLIISTTLLNCQSK